MWFRRTSTVVAQDASLSPPDPHRKIPVYDPQGIADRLNRTFRRRLSDRIESVFQEACLSGDLDTAEELLSVLVNLHKRRSEKFGNERRISDHSIVKAREELTRRKAAVALADRR